jgi:hypothetical protein
MAKSTSKLFADDKKKSVDAEVIDNKVVESVEDTLDMNEPVVDTPDEIDEPEVKTPKVRNIDLGILKKSRFNINGDPDNVLELNTRDMGIAPRLNDAYPKLDKLMDEIAEKFNSVGTDDSLTEDEFATIADSIKILDNKMREELDYIFDAPVSEKCGADGNMWDPIEGAFRYEHIIDILSALYENDLHTEFSKMRKRVNAKTKKYTTAKKFHK